MSGSERGRHCTRQSFHGNERAEMLVNSSKMATRFFSANVMRTAVTIHLGYSFGKGCMHGHYNAGGILFGNYRVPQQSGPRQNSLWQGFHSNQDPDRILFGKGSTGIKMETGLSPASGPRELRPRAESRWPRFCAGHGRGQGHLSVFLLSADVVLNGRE